MLGDGDARSASLERDVEMVVAGERAGLLDFAKHAPYHRPQRILHDFIVRDQAFGRLLAHAPRVVASGLARSSGVMLMPIDATLPYDEANIFARILRQEIPSNKIYEDEFALAFNDIHPLAPTHILVIPKGPYVSWDDFSERASEQEIAGFVRAVGNVAREAGLVEDGYRLLANTGLDSGQEVPHLHVHIFAGRPLGPMLRR